MARLLIGRCLPLLLAVACWLAGAARARAASIGVPAVDCYSASGDSDSDGITDACEVAFATTFPPELVFHPDERGGIPAMSPVWVVAPNPDVPPQSGRRSVRVIYFPSYLQDHGAFAFVRTVVIPSSSCSTSNCAKATNGSSPRRICRPTTEPATTRACAQTPRL
jgi:hypothetical protein